MIQSFIGALFLARLTPLLIIIPAIAQAAPSTLEPERFVLLEMGRMLPSSLPAKGATLDFNKGKTPDYPISQNFDLPEITPGRLQQSTPARAKELVGSIRGLFEFSMPISQLDTVVRVNLRKRKISTEMSKNWKIDFSNLGEINQAASIRYEARF